MVDAKKRIKYMFYILTQQDDYIRSSDLAKLVGVTERTIKSDMQELSEYAENVGARLVSKKGIGYRLIAEDVEAVDAVKEQLMIHFMVMGNDQNSSKSRVNMILRKILIEKKYINQDNLADSLFLSKSSISEDIKQVNFYLNQFSLRWRKKNEIGDLIQGTELNKRMLMLCVFENHYHEAVAMYKDDNFLYWFKCDDKRRLDIRQTLLKHLRQSECHIRDDHTQRISRYLCLMINRVLEGYNIELTNKQRIYIRKLKQYSVSQLIFEEISKYHEYAELNEDEVLAFGLLLAEWADVSRTCDLDLNYSDQVKDARQFLKKYEIRIKKEYGIQLNKFDDYQRVLTSGLIPLLIQKDFNCCNQTIRIISRQDPRVKDCPLASQMACDASELFEQEYGISLSQYNILTFSSILHTLFLSIEYKFKPLRLLICTTNGLQFSYMLSQIINTRFGSYFESLDCFELYELRELKREDYDCVILTMPSFSYKYDWPFIIMNSLPTQEQLNELFNQFVLNNVDLDNVTNHLSLNNINIFRNFEYTSGASFRQLLSFKHGKDSETIKHIEKDLQYKAPIHVFNKVCVMFIKRSLTTQNCFDIYQLKQESIYEDFPVKYFVVLSFHFNNSLQSARFMNDIIYMFFNDIQNINNVIRSGMKEELIQIVRESLKSLPISLTQGK